MYFLSIVIFTAVIKQSVKVHGSHLLHSYLFIFLASSLSFILSIWDTFTFSLYINYLIHHRVLLYFTFFKSSQPVFSSALCYCTAELMSWHGCPSSVHLSSIRRLSVCWHCLLRNCQVAWHQILVTYLHFFFFFFFNFKFLIVLLFFFSFSST